MPPKASDFTSYPGATMDNLRKSQVRQIETYIGYLNRMYEDALKMEVPASTLEEIAKKGMF